MGPNSNIFSFFCFFLSRQCAKEWKPGCKWWKWGRGIVYTSFSEGEELRHAGGSSDWSCCPSPSRAESVQASGQAGKRPKSEVRTGWRDNISHLHPRKPQHASMGAGCRWWGDDSLRLYYWNRHPFDPNLGSNIKYSWTGNNKLCNLKQVFPAWTAVDDHGINIWSCGAWQRRVLRCELLTWIRPLTRTHRPDRRRSH